MRFVCCYFNNPTCSSSSDISVRILPSVTSIPLEGFETAESDLIPRSHLSEVSMLPKVLLNEHNHGVSVGRERERAKKKTQDSAFSVCIFFFS